MRFTSTIVATILFASIASSAPAVAPPGASAPKAAGAPNPKAPVAPVPKAAGASKAAGKAPAAPKASTGSKVFAESKAAAQTAGSKDSTGFDASLIPATEVTPGNADCQGDSIGPNNGVKIPCSCPPTDAELAATVQQQHPNIPMGTDVDSTLQRFQLTLASLQSLKCPGAATKLVPKLQKLGQLKAGAASDAEVADIIKATGDVFSPKLFAGAGPGFNGQEQG
ncbi:hypothetical protein DFS34DRAFT_688086 [Phlyctochytrium arcticum]|nr:hypothetical protein DFS34DRAFT_688086 [Phlyctochytrium arcticum]